MADRIAADWRCLRQEYSSVPSIEVFCSTAPMNDGVEFVLHSLWNIKPVQLGMQQMGQNAVILASTSDDMSGSIQYSVKLVVDGLGCPSERDVAVVQSRRHEGVY